MSWIIQEALKKDTTKDYVIIENPTVRDYIDEQLVTEYYPFIMREMEASNYIYSPYDKAELTTIKSFDTLTRSMYFMLFNEEKIPFFRGNLDLSMEHWMIHSEHFLSLSQDTEPRFIFEILGNSRFAGCPPELTVHKKEVPYIFQITFNHGSGFSRIINDAEKIKASLKKVIEINIEMYEISAMGISDSNDLSDFLTLAYEVYEAY